MSIVPIQPSLQIVPVMHENADLGQTESLLTALSLSESSVIDEGKKTASKFERFVAAMQKQFTALATENRALREQFITLESRLREITILHQEEITAAQRELQAESQEVQTLRQEMIEIAQRAEARVAAEIAAKTVAVLAATAAGEARLADSQQETAAARQEIERLHQEMAQQKVAAAAEKNAAVAAATQVGEAQITAARLETEAVRQEAARARALADETERQTKDTDKMQMCCFEIGNAYKLSGYLYLFDWIPACRNWTEQFQALIDQRRKRSIDLNNNVAQQRSDTQKLQQLALGLMPLFSLHCQFQNRFSNMGLQVQEKMVALIAERNSR